MTTTIKSRPLLFSAPMVRALLAGTKTQTRRAIKPQPDISDWLGLQSMFGYAGGDRSKPFGDWHQWRIVGPDYPDSDEDDVWCPWAARELIWVRETWLEDGCGILYRAHPNCEGVAQMLGGWRPSIFMPRRASRLTLRITEVRAQELQQISEVDAIAEGIERDGEGWKSYEIIHQGRHKGERHPHAVVPNRSPITSYRELWESINGAGSWAANPWVWALTFDVIQKNITEVLKDG